MTQNNCWPKHFEMIPSLGKMIKLQSPVEFKTPAIYILK